MMFEYCPQTVVAHFETKRCIKEYTWSSLLLFALGLKSTRQAADISDTVIKG